MVNFNIVVVVAVVVVFESCKGFEVYWNVPTQNCQQYGIHFNLSDYRIIQNEDDKFHGNRITILYEPGQFPHFDGSNPVWGGIPQKANLTAHLEAFQAQTQRLIPQDFNGYAVLDFEAYQPSLSVSAGVYRRESELWVQGEWPSLPAADVPLVASETFTDTACLLLTELLKAGRNLRPGAKWGYYHYPYCRNWKDSVMCSPEQVEANEKMESIFQESGVLNPSLYVFSQGPISQKFAERVRQRLLTTFKVRGPRDTAVMPYVWFKYHDDVEKYVSSLDWQNTLVLAKDLQADGAIIWGSSNDVQSQEKCQKLKEYVETTLGPIVKQLSETSPQN